MNFKIQGETIELAQLLKATGIVETGGHAKQIIQSGEVKVDGNVETRRGCKLRPGQTVTFKSDKIQLT